jgi:hypothetical protein
LTPFCICSCWRELRKWSCLRGSAPSSGLSDHRQQRTRRPEQGGGHSGAACARDGGPSSGCDSGASCAHNDDPSSGRDGGASSSGEARASTKRRRRSEGQGVETLRRRHGARQDFWRGAGEATGRAGRRAEWRIVSDPRGGVFVERDTRGRTIARKKIQYARRVPHAGCAPPRGRS